MRKLKFMGLLALLAGAVGGSATSASAASLQPAAASVNFTGTSIGSHTFALQGVLMPSVTCGVATYVGVKPPNQSAVTFTPTYSNCTTTIVSSRPAAVNQVPAPCSWWLSVTGSTFTPATGALTGAIVNTCGSSVVTVPSIPLCRITIAGQPLTTGITGQNRTAGDAANAPAGGAAAGSRLIASATPASYTASGCPGVTSPAVGSYTGTVYTAGVWFGP